jgi:hypothetical protein
MLALWAWMNKAPLAGVVLWMSQAPLAGVFIDKLAAVDKTFIDKFKEALNIEMR